MCSWVFLSCDVHPASSTETVSVYMFNLFATYDPNISILFSSTELLRVLVQSIFQQLVIT